MIYHHLNNDNKFELDLGMKSSNKTIGEDGKVKENSLYKTSQKLLIEKLNSIYCQG